MSLTRIFTAEKETTSVWIPIRILENLSPIGKKLFLQGKSLCLAKKLASQRDRDRISSTHIEHSKCPLNSLSLHNSDTYIYTHKCISYMCVCLRELFLGHFPNKKSVCSFQNFHHHHYYLTAAFPMRICGLRSHHTRNWQMEYCTV